MDEPNYPSVTHKLLVNLAIIKKILSIFDLTFKMGEITEKRLDMLSLPRISNVNLAHALCEQYPKELPSLDMCVVGIVKM